MVPLDEEEYRRRGIRRMADKVCSRDYSKSVIMIWSVILACSILHLVYIYNAMWKLRVKTPCPGSLRTQSGAGMSEVKVKGVIPQALAH